jgi:hypothetical protein
MKILSRLTWWIVEFLHKASEIPSLAWSDFKEQKICKLWLERNKNGGTFSSHQGQRKLDEVPLPIQSYVKTQNMGEIMLRHSAMMNEYKIKQIKARYYKDPFDVHGEFR